MNKKQWKEQLVKNLDIVLEASDILESNRIRKAIFKSVKKMLLEQFPDAAIKKIPAPADFTFRFCIMDKEDDNEWDSKCFFDLCGWPTNVTTPKDYTFIMVILPARVGRYDSDKEVYKYGFAGYSQLFQDYLDTQKNIPGYLNNKYSGIKRILPKIKNLDPRLKKCVKEFRADNGVHLCEITLNFKDCNIEEELKSNLQFLFETAEQASKIVCPWTKKLYYSIEKEAKEKHCPLF